MFCVFYFIKISKFALPGVMLIYERTSKDRKKERICLREFHLPVFFPISPVLINLPGGGLGLDLT